MYYVSTWSLRVAWCFYGQQFERVFLSYLLSEERTSEFRVRARSEGLVFMVIVTSHEKLLLLVMLLCSCCCYSSRRPGREELQCRRC